MVHNGMAVNEFTVAAKIMRRKCLIGIFANAPSFKASSNPLIAIKSSLQAAKLHPSNP